MPNLRPMPLPSVALGGLPKADMPGGLPKAERSMSFMRMYWYLLRWETWLYVAMGRGLWRARAAMMASFSSSESTAPEGSRSSGSGALASIAAPVGCKNEFVRGIVEAPTLLFSLVLFLVLCKEHVVGQAATRHRPLETHAMRLAG